MASKTAAATAHMTPETRDKLRVLSQLNGYSGELSPFIEHLIEQAIVKADLQFQLMQQAFGIQRTERTPTEGENDA